MNTTRRIAAIMLAAGMAIALQSNAATSSAAEKTDSHAYRGHRTQGHRYYQKLRRVFVVTVSGPGYWSDYVNVERIKRYQLSHGFLTRSFDFDSRADAENLVKRRQGKYCYVLFRKPGAKQWYCVSAVTRSRSSVWARHPRPMLFTDSGHAAG